MVLIQEAKILNVYNAQIKTVINVVLITQHAILVKNITVSIPMEIVSNAPIQTATIASN